MFYNDNILVRVQAINIIFMRLHNISILMFESIEGSINAQRNE